MEIDLKIAQVIIANDMVAMKKLLSQVVIKFDDLWLLEIAAKENHAHFVQMLIPLTVDYREQNPGYSFDPIAAAIEWGRTECIKLLEPISNIRRYL